MAQKISLRKGNNAKTGQKYKNVTAFKHNKNSKLTRKIESLPVHELCPRCYEIIQWRKQYRKYKPLTAPKKCVGCQQKTVRDAYHVLCLPCAQSKGCCAKCMETEKEIISTGQMDQRQEQIERAEEEILLQGLSERQRRTYRRKQLVDEEDAREFLDKCKKMNADRDDFDDDFFDSEDDDESELGSDDDEDDASNVDSDESEYSEAEETMAQSSDIQKLLLSNQQD